MTDHAIGKNTGPGSSLAPVLGALLLGAAAIGIVGLLVVTKDDPVTGSTVAPATPAAAPVSVAAAPATVGATATALPSAKLPQAPTAVLGDATAPFLTFLAEPRMAEAANGTFDTFRSLVAAAGLAGTYNAPGPLTVFVPTDEAFARAFTAAQLEALKANPVLLADLLNHHVVPGSWHEAKVGNRAIMPTLHGDELQGSTQGGVLRVDGSAVRAADIIVGNGVLYAVNDVLPPPSFQLPS